MNSCELTAFVTALANALARNLSEEELALLGSVLTQLADTLFTIAAQRAICCSGAPAHLFSPAPYNDSVKGAQNP